MYEPEYKPNRYSLTPEQYAQLRNTAASEGRNANVLVRELILAYLDGKTIDDSTQSDAVTSARDTLAVAESQLKYTQDYIREARGLLKHIQ